MSATLGIATLAYLPFCFFNLVNVLISFVYALLGFKIKHIKPDEVILAPLEEATLYGIGDRRLEPTEHEAALSG